MHDVSAKGTDGLASVLFLFRMGLGAESDDEVEVNGIGPRRDRRDSCPVGIVEIAW